MIDVVRSAYDVTPADGSRGLSSRERGAGVTAGYGRYRVARAAHHAAYGRGLTTPAELRQFTHALDVDDRRRFTLQYYAALCARSARERANGGFVR